MPENHCATHFAEAPNDKDPERMSQWNPQLLEVFFTKLRLNLKAEVSKTYLGYAWWVL